MQRRQLDAGRVVVQKNRHPPAGYRWFFPRQAPATPAASSPSSPSGRYGQVDYSAPPDFPHRYSGRLDVTRRFRSLVSTRDRSRDPRLSSRRVSCGHAAAIPGCSDRRPLACDARARPCDGSHAVCPMFVAAWQLPGGTHVGGAADVDAGLFVVPTLKRTKTAACARSRLGRTLSCTFSIRTRR